MAEDREKARAALLQAEALLALAEQVEDAVGEQDAALRRAVDGSLLKLPLPPERGAANSGVAAIALGVSGRPSVLVDTVAAQAHARPALQAQLSSASAIRRSLPSLVEEARPVTQGRLRGLFSSKKTREHAEIQFAALVKMLDHVKANGVAQAWNSALTNTTSGRADAVAATSAASKVLGLAAPRGPHVSVKVEQLDVIRRFLAIAPSVLRHRPPLVSEVKRTFESVQDRMVSKQLAEMPTTALKQATANRVRFKSLSEARCHTVDDVLRAGSARLGQVNGISETTARQLFAAAQRLRQAVKDDLRFRIDLDRSDTLVTRLLTTLFLLRQYDRVLEGRGRDLQAALDLLRPLAAISKEVTQLSIVGGSDPTNFLMQIRETVSDLEGSGLLQLLTQVSPGQGHAPGADRVWDDFERDSAGYYTVLGQIVELDLGEDAAAGNLPAEIVAAVHAQPLDEVLLEGKVSLRGYQSFGARYALVQRRTLLGDEMGLGKTVQAIAVMAHLSGGGAKHHLVVCPASVLVNWTSEVRRHSALEAFLVHGSDRDRTWRTWQRRGGVAVTTFGTLPVLPAPPAQLPLIVVDEAHYLKNPQTQRARALLPLVDRAERALFLTGTPLENRLGEFQQLVTYLQPEAARRLAQIDGLASARRYREELAPVYLRRNQEDVLQELPDLVVTPEWSSFTAHQMPGYRMAVAARNFMRMRRVAIVDHPGHSEKLARLQEITNDAAANGRKVIVFSYFRDVLEEVAEVLGERVVGPLTGSVPATKRQAIIDEFGRAGADAVLLSQITAGGTGMNMQAGSVVIICEPQVKPSLESQAIARAHRMGQLRGVQVHRLLTTDSVDQRMVELLEEKQRLFDEYARGSEVAASSAEAVDVSEKKLAAEVIDLEMERLAVSRAEQLAAEREDEEDN
ncbi:DEAD/DEAH box helicase [Actinomycetospora sp. NBRC 106378]|uniref:DEAD/DEAH box helicase n=1 Tax=Actinomycetospora sp. NBRC 106378 TaxID=3032208 RepID=UPI0024A302E4|nr:DEAD/DEAH box helicase [Actinomycetospora sp. NBRC 106378]GLZ51346.1 helicase SNF2 [Actinomycetospora sp. NBRC 106378]